MALRTSRLAAASALAAALSLATTPAAALDLPRPAGVASAKAYDADAGNVHHRRDRHHRGNGVDAGDILAGVLILGGIAAVASAASQSNDRRDDYPPQRDYPPPPPPRDRYPQNAPYPPPAERGAQQSRGLDHAMDICVSEVERGGERVSSVESAARTGEGWNVGGVLQGGAHFSCWIDNEGRVGDIDIDAPYDSAGYSDPADPAAPMQDNQWDDDYYARARANLRYSTPDVEPAPPEDSGGYAAPQGNYAYSARE